MLEGDMAVDTPDALQEEPAPLIPLTTVMWEHVLQRLTNNEKHIARQDAELAALRLENSTLKRGEPKVADPAPFKGDRKELPTFLSMCDLNFAGNPSRFRTEQDKIIYAGSRLEGPAFAWFQPKLTKLRNGEPTPSELTSFKTFAKALNTLYGDPDREATAEREIYSLRQTGSVADYASKFEAKSQYLTWNDSGFRAQFYRNLKDEVKDEIARGDKPESFADLRTLAIRLDARLYERRLERGNPSMSKAPLARVTTPTGPQPMPDHAPTQAPKMTTAPTTRPGQPAGGLRVPSHTPDGTYPMELGARSWHLTDAEKQRRRDLGLCGYCGEGGHFRQQCPARPPPRAERRNMMTVELTQPETPAENTGTQE